MREQPTRVTEAMEAKKHQDVVKRTVQAGKQTDPVWSLMAQLKKFNRLTWQQDLTFLTQDYCADTWTSTKWVPEDWGRISRSGGLFLWTTPANCCTSGPLKTLCLWERLMCRMRVLTLKLSAMEVTLMDGNMSLKFGGLLRCFCSEGVLIFWTRCVPESATIHFARFMFLPNSSRLFHCWYHFRV